jgi:hypothetical protein
MKKIIQVFCFIQLSLLIVTFSFSQQPPSWTTSSGRNAMFPQGQYLVGFKSDVADYESEADQVLGNLEKLAKNQVVENIRVTIKSTAKFDIINVNTETDESFQQVSTSFSEASLTGLKSETYFDRKNKEAFAIAYVKIADLIASCKANLAEKEKRVNQKIESARQLVAAGSIEPAVTEYYDCFPILHEMENDIVLIASVGKEGMDVDVAGLEAKVHQGISAIRKEVQLTLDQTCFFLADGLKQEVRDQDLEGFMGMGSFTFQDTRMGSVFSARLNATLEQKLTRVKFNIKNMDEVRKAVKERDIPVYLISGTYWEEGDQIKILACIRRVQDGKNIASMEEYLPKEWLEKNKISYLPDNFEEARIRQQQLQENPVADQGLQVKVWTNKGSEDPLFRQGDSMWVYIDANRPCYIRLIYYLADGRKTLLVDNYQITPEKVNIPIRYPDPFICDAPYGQETLQLNAQTESFSPLNTEYKDGYLFISDDMQTILENVRGMKNPAQNIQRAEKRVDITTVSR